MYIVHVHVHVLVYVVNTCVHVIGFVLMLSVHCTCLYKLHYTCTEGYYDVQCTCTCTEGYYNLHVLRDIMMYNVHVHVHVLRDIIIYMY